MKLIHSENINSIPKWKANFALGIRVLTLSPIMSAMLVILLYFFSDCLNWVGLVVGLIFLTAFPLISYPISAVVPFLKRKGRKGQRYFAIIMSVIGYVAGLVYAIFFGHSRVELAMYIVYLISGILIALLSFVIKFQASGHSASIAGPIAFLCVFVNLKFLFLSILFVLSLIASVMIKRHTVSQFIVGALCPLIGLVIALLIIV